MNKFTLTFNSSKFETLYRQKQHKKELQLFQFNYRVLVSSAMVAIVNEIMQGDYIKILFIFLLLCFNYGIKKLGNFSLFGCQLLVNTYILYQLLSGSIKDMNQKDYSQYTMGLFHAFAQYGTYIGTRFFLKTLGFLMNTLSIFIYIFITNNTIFVGSRVLYLISIVLALNFLYIYEKQKRECFMVQQENQQWKSGLNSVLDINLIQCTYHKPTLQIILENLNEQAKDFFKLNKVYDFKNFIRNIILTKLEQGKLTIEQYLKIIQESKSQNMQKVSLEIFLYNLMKNEQRKDFCKEEHMYEQNYQYFGLFNKKLYKLNIFFYYAQETIAVIMFQQQEDYERDLQYQLKIKHNYQVQQKILSSNQQLVKIIGILKNLVISSQQQQKVPRRLFFHKNLNLCLSSSYLQYNKLINVQCYTERQILSKIYNHFNLFKLISQLELILQPIFREKQRILTIKYKNINEQTQLVSCYWMLMQILLNLVINSIQYSYPCLKVYLKISRTYNYKLKQNLIKFQIINNGPKIQKSQIQELPVINPQNLEEYIQNSKQVNLKLGIVVAKQLLAIIGFSQLKLQFLNLSNHQRFSILQFGNEQVENNFIGYKNYKEEKSIQLL